jgi:hypothetical protein
VTHSDRSLTVLLGASFAVLGLSFPCVMHPGTRSRGGWVPFALGSLGSGQQACA